MLALLNATREHCVNICRVFVDFRHLLESCEFSIYNQFHLHLILLQHLHYDLPAGKKEHYQLPYTILTISMHSLHLDRLSIYDYTCFSAWFELR